MILNNESVCDCGCEYDDEKNFLLDVIRTESFLVQETEFTLASGKQSHVYINLKKALLNRDCLGTAGLAVLNSISDLIDDYSRNGQRVLIAGMELGAVPIVIEVGAMTGCDMLIIRKAPKEHGTANAIEGAYQQGDKIILLEDVVTSGGSTIKAVKACQDAGLDVVMAVTLVDRQEGAQEAIEDLYPEINYTSVLTKQDFFQTLEISDPDLP